MPKEKIEANKEKTNPTLVLSPMADFNYTGYVNLTGDITVAEGDRMFIVDAVFYLIGGSIDVYGELYIINSEVHIIAPDGEPDIEAWNDSRVYIRDSDLSNEKLVARNTSLVSITFTSVKKAVFYDNVTVYLVNVTIFFVTVFNFVNIFIFNTTIINIFVYDYVYIEVWYVWIFLIEIYNYVETWIYNTVINLIEIYNYVDIYIYYTDIYYVYIYNVEIINIYYTQIDYIEIYEVSVSIMITETIINIVYVYAPTIIEITVIMVKFNTIYIYTGGLALAYSLNLEITKVFLHGAAIIFKSAYALEIAAEGDGHLSDLKFDVSGEPVTKMAPDGYEAISKGIQIGGSGVIDLYLHSSVDSEYLTKRGVDLKSLTFAAFDPITNEISDVPSIYDSEEGVVSGNTTLAEDKDPIFYLLGQAGPLIENVSWDPLSPAEMESVTVTADVFDLNGVNTTILYYSTNIGDYGSILMERGSEYTASIPGFPLGTIVTFYMVANDSFGNMAGSEEYIYIVAKEEEIMLPEVISVTWTPEEPTSNDEVTVTALTSENVVEAILSYYNGEQWVNVTMTKSESYFEATIPPMEINYVVFTIYVGDAVGNWAESDVYVYHISIIKKVEPLQNPAITGGIGFSLGVAVVGLALLARRRV